ncbi:hypothetical protein Tco_0332741 [Tanacetum coccineum]
MSSSLGSSTLVQSQINGFGKVLNPFLSQPAPLSYTRPSGSKDGMAGSKGFPRLVAHIKRLHLSSDDRRRALREALSTDCELFVLVGEALKALDQWLCGVCMCLHALSRACHHTDGMTQFKWVVGDVEEFLVGIVRPQVRREAVPLGGVVVDEVLLDLPKVDDVSLVDGVFDGAFGGDGEEDVVIGEGVVVTSSSLEMLTKSCLGGMMVSLISLKG